jgi:hypothetical protein
MPGLLRGVARVAVASGTATAVSNRVSRRQAERWSDQGQPYSPSRVYPTEQAAPPPYPPQQAAPPPPAAQPSTIDQLKELAELRQQGILTDEEFAAQKAKILAG